MSEFTHIGELKRHRYIFVDSKYTHKEDIGFIPAVWFGLSSLYGRAYGVTVMLESGAIFRNIPPHGISFKRECEKFWQLKDAQLWNCYGNDFTILEYKYLQELQCKVRTNGNELFGIYLFTVGPLNDAFSAYPEQSKEFMFIELNNGRLTIQPTNRVIFSELSFTKRELKFPDNLKVQTEIYSVEDILT